MTLEKLIEIGLSEEQAKNILSNIQKEIEENYIEKSKYNEILTTESQLKNDIKQRDKQLEELKKINVDELKNKIEILQKDNENQKKNHAVDMEIMKAKGRNPKAIKALIDFNNIKVKDDGTVEGLNLDDLKKSDSYLFEIEKVTKSGTGFTAGKNNISTKDPKDMSFDEYQVYWEQNNQNI